MLEISTLPEDPINNPQVRESGSTASGELVSDGFKAEHGEEGDRNSTANRWPREETMALLKIRSEMDVAFRDITPKAPLWEQVSRKLAELGYNRSAKKCKEKFENIYKYHRRIKEGRCGRPNNGKTYRFFEQLEALQGHTLPPPPQTSSKEQLVEVFESTRTSPTTHVQEHYSISTTSSSGKFKRFFEGLMREVIEKQETMQRNFMEVLEKCEQDRMAREEAWKNEELARIKRERELLAQERSIVAAKNEAVLGFLKKFRVHFPEKIIEVPNNGMQENASGSGSDELEKQECGNVSVGNFIQMSSSRWPKEEVEALIRLRTQLELQPQGNGSKGPLWEEISLAMKSLGYDRSAKRCKEKWENINKYFKRMKEKNKRKPEDSKTCPYYHHLEAIYSRKPKKVDDAGSAGSGNELKPEELLMHIVGSHEERSQQLESLSEDADRENMEQNHQGENNEDQSGYQMVANSPSIAIMG
ncbi:trihelix transcription factor GT-2-like [Gastrolobium bilobum]|uniref:trihelix transcription factor GT-2-like n=1 Tax=Gastrolobium bilobum TaxID=150636 RepID=UPI002AB116BA|nr:trihelix transcription factor GT-2-like [Gastrolobium bilobum]